MPTKIPSCRHVLPQKSVETCVNSRFNNTPRLPKVTYLFTPVPQDALRGIRSHLHAVFLALVESARLGVYDPAVRWLAAYACKGERQVKRDLAELCGLGLIKRIFRRIARFRNQTNVYEIPAMRVGVMDDTEKLKKVLTTTTSALARGAMDQPPILKSWIQTLFEGRAAQDRADSAWKKQEYERKWTFWDSMNGWRLEKAEARNRRAMVGVYTGPKLTPEEQEADMRYFREKGMLGGMMEA